MFSKMVLVLAIGASMLQAPLAAPVARCCSPSDSHQASFADGCCEAMACCIISGASSDKAVTPPAPCNELASFPAPVCLVSLIEFPTNPQGVRLAKAPPVAHSPPPLALLCTYLI